MGFPFKMHLTCLLTTGWILTIPFPCCYFKLKLNW